MYAPQLLLTSTPLLTDNQMESPNRSRLQSTSPVTKPSSARRSLADTPTHSPLARPHTHHVDESLMPPPLSVPVSEGADNGVGSPLSTASPRHRTSRHTSLRLAECVDGWLLPCEPHGQCNNNVTSMTYCVRFIGNRRRDHRPFPHRSPQPSLQSLGSTLQSLSPSPSNPLTWQVRSRWVSHHSTPHPLARPPHSFTHPPRRLASPAMQIQSLTHRPRTPPRSTRVATLTIALMHITQTRPLS